MPRIRRAGWFEATALSLLAVAIICLLSDPKYVKKFARAYSRPKPVVRTTVIPQTAIKQPRSEPIATLQKAEAMDIEGLTAARLETQGTNKTAVEFAATNTQLASVVQQPIPVTLSTPVVVVTYPTPPIQPYAPRKSLIDEIASHTLDPFFRITLYPARVILHPVVQDANSGRFASPPQTPNYGNSYHYQYRSAAESGKTSGQTANHK
jgi:hypothetical protein